MSAEELRDALVETEDVPLMTSSEHRKCFRNFYLRFALAFLGSVLAAGTLGGWSQFVSLLVDAGTFDEGCRGQPLGKCVVQNGRLQLLVLLGSVAQNILSIPVGVWYDRHGPLVVGLAGFFAAAVGLVGLGIGISFKSMEGMLWFSVPLLNLGQTISSWGIFGFIFFYPRYVGVLVGLANSSFLISGLMMYLVVLITRASSLLYGIVFLLASTLTAVALTWVSVPSLREYRESYCRAFPSSKERMETPQPLAAMLKELWRAFAWRPAQSICYLCSSTALFIASQYYMSSVYQYNNYNLTGPDSNLLALLSVVFFAVVGALASPLSGALYDWVGIRIYVLLFIGLCIVTTSIVWLPYLSAQIIAAILVYVWYSGWLTLESKTPAVFAPASLYGSYLGTCNTITSLLQLGLSFAIPAWTIFHGNQWEFLLPLLVLFACAIAFTALFEVSLIRGTVARYTETPNEVKEVN